VAVKDGGLGHERGKDGTGLRKCKTPRSSQTPKTEPNC